MDYKLGYLLRVMTARLVNGETVMVLGSFLAFLLLTRAELCPDSEGATRLSGRFTGFSWTLSGEDAKVPIRLSNN